VVRRPSAAAAFAADGGDAVSCADAAGEFGLGWESGHAIIVTGAISSAVILIAILQIADS
jgi:hypothetical protein